MAKLKILATESGEGSVTLQEQNNMKNIVIRIPSKSGQLLTKEMAQKIIKFLLEEYPLINRGGT